MPSKVGLTLGLSGNKDHEKSKTNCQNGFRQLSPKKCTDIDECLEGIGFYSLFSSLSVYLRDFELMELY